MTKDINIILNVNISAINEYKVYVYHLNFKKAAVRMHFRSNGIYVLNFSSF